MLFVGELPPHAWQCLWRSHIYATSVSASRRHTACDAELPLHGGPSRVGLRPAAEHSCFVVYLTSGSAARPRRHCWHTARRSFSSDLALKYDGSLSTQVYLVREETDSRGCSEVSRSSPQTSACPLTTSTAWGRCHYCFRADGNGCGVRFCRMCDVRAREIPRL